MDLYLLSVSISKSHNISLLTGRKVFNVLESNYISGDKSEYFITTKRIIPFLVEQKFAYPSLFSSRQL